LDNVQIEILDSDNSIQGVLEVGNVKNFPISLTSSIADIKDISARSGSFSLSFKVPSTKDNDNLLEHIYLSQHKNYKDFDAEKDCRIRVNGITLENGKLRITRISRQGRDADSYSLTFFGNNMDWVLSMKDKTTQDLPYLDTTYTYDDATVRGTWTNSGGSELPVFSLINRGTKDTLNAFNVLDVRPDYFVRDYLNNAFKSIGYNFESSFFSSAAGSKLIIPFFGKNFRDYERSVPNTAIVMMDSNVTNFDNTFTSSTGYYTELLNFDALQVSEMEDQRINWKADTFTAHGFNGISITNATKVADFDDTPSPLKDTNNNFASNVYTVPYNNRYRVTTDIEAILTEDQTKQFLDPEFSYYVKLTTTGGAVSIIPLFGVGTGNTTLTTVSANRRTRQINRRVQSTWFGANATDTIEIGYKFKVRKGLGNYTADDYYFKLVHNAKPITIEPIYLLDEGDNFNWKTVSDDTISLLDIVLDIGRLHHIYWRTNVATKTVYAEPRDDFYNALSTATNETDRVDPASQFEITYNSSYYNRDNIFRYKEDDKDGYLKARNEEAVTDWCSYEHKYPSKFKEGTTTLETKVLAATYTIEDIYCGGDVPPILARFWSDETSIKNIYENEVLAPRILYYKYDSQTDIDGNNRNFQWRTESTKRTIIPYALPFSIIEEGVTMADVAGELSFKEIAGSDGLWYDYFSNTAAEIRDGKRLRIKLKTDLVDYINLDFRKPIYFDNRYPEIEGYWRIISIDGFKPTSNEISTSYDLIQAKNFNVEAPTPNTLEDVDSLSDNNYSAARYMPPNTGTNSSSNRSSGMPNIEFGTDNDINDASNMAFGRGLSTDGYGNLRMGVNNLDVSTDIFQLGTGTPSSPFSLIRVDSSGNTYFNGKIVIPNKGPVEVDFDYTVNDIDGRIEVDCSSGDITITMPSAPSDNNEWEIVDIGNANPNRITLNGNGYTINNEDEIYITEPYEVRKLYFTGTEYILI